MSANERKLSLKAAAELAGGWAGLMSGGISVPFGMWSLYHQGTEKLVFAILAFAALAYFCITLIKQILALQERIRPKAVIQCGEHVPDSITRNFPSTFTYTIKATWQTLHARPPIESTHSETKDVDFFGFVITNPGAEPLIGCRAEMTKLEKNGTVLWDKVSALTFAPKKRADEGQTEVEVRNGVPQSVAVCSIREDGEIFHGSLNQSWRFTQPFKSFFKDHGDYVFTVVVSSSSTGTSTTARFVLKWGGTKESTTLGLL